MAARSLFGRLLIAGSLAVSLAGVAAGVAGAKTDGAGRVGSTKATILLGNISTINNPAIQATDLVNGTKAWVGYINSKGGIKGRKLELKVCDDQGNAALSIQCANNLLQDGVVGFVGMWSIVFGANALPPVQQANAAILGGWPITDQEFSSSIEFPVTAGSAGAYPALAISMRARGAKNLAGIWLNTPASVFNSDLVKDLWPRVGGSSYKSVYYAANAPDLTPVAADAVGSGASAIFLGTPPAFAARLLQAIRNTGYKGQLGMTGLAAVPSVMVAAGSNLNNVHMTYPGVAIGHGTADLQLYQNVIPKYKVPADALSEVGAASGQYMYDVLNSIKGTVTRASVLAAARKHTTWKGFLTHSMSNKFAPKQYPAIRNPYNVIVQYSGGGRMHRTTISGYKRFVSTEKGVTFISGFPR